MNSKGRLLLVLALVLVLAGAGGCSSGARLAVVSGKVTYKGQPVTGGVIAFYPQSGGSYTASLDANGSYSVPGLPRGEAGVSIDTESVRRQGMAADSGKMHPQPAGSSSGGPGGPPPGIKYVKIPPKYGDQKTSELSVTLTPGNQEKNFDLTD